MKVAGSPAVAAAKGRIAATGIQTMSKLRVLLVAVFLSSACEISEGNFDGSFFEDGTFGEDEDAGADEEDAGKAPPKDAGKADAGPSKSDASTMDAGITET